MFNFGAKNSGFLDLYVDFDEVMKRLKPRHIEYESRFK